MAWMDGKALWFFLPALTEVFIRGKPSKRFESFSAIVGHREGVEVPFEVLRHLVIDWFDGGFFEGAVQAPDLAIRPGAIGCGEAVLAAGLLTHTRKDMLAGIVIPLALGAPTAGVRQDRRELIGPGRDEVAQGWRRDGRDGLRVPRGLGKRAGAVNAEDQVEPACFGTYCGHIAVEVFDRLGRELFLLRLVAFQP